MTGLWNMSSIFQIGLCGQHAAQSSWNFWNSCMLQKSAAVFFFFKYSWLMNRTSLSNLSPTTVWHGIQHLSCYGCWLILSVLRGVSHKPWISLWAGKGSSWSARYHWHLLLLPADPSVPPPAAPLALIHPRGWGSRRAVPPGMAQPPLKWQVAGDPSRCLHFILPSPHPPFAGY